MQDETSTSGDKIADLLDVVVNDVSPPSPIADRVIETVQPQLFANDSQPSAAIPEKKKRGRPKKDVNAAPSVKEPLRGLPKGGESRVIPTAESGQEAVEPAAEVAVALVAGSGLLLAGEAGAMLADEKALAKNAFVSYFKIKGVESVPAWVILAGGLAPFYIRVLTTPPARTKISTWVEKGYFAAKRLFGGLRNARSNRRDDTKRQNDSSETTSE